MNNRWLGVIGMLCAPALLVEVSISSSSTNHVIVGVCSLVFMLGSFASHVGLWRIAASGRNWWGRGVLGFQLLLVVLAFLFGVFEATALLADDNILFMITDMAWPISMIWMLPLGITIAVVKQLQGWQRFVSLLCGCAFPGSMLISGLAGWAQESDAGSYFFFGSLAVLFVILGWVVSQSERLAVGAPGTNIALSSVSNQ